MANPAAGYTTEEVPAKTSISHVSTATLAASKMSSYKFSLNLQCLGGGDTDGEVHDTGGVDDVEDDDDDDGGAAPKLFNSCLNLYTYVYTIAGSYYKHRKLSANFSQTGT